MCTVIDPNIQLQTAFLYVILMLVHYSHVLVVVEMGGFLVL